MEIHWVMSLNPYLIQLPVFVMMFLGKYGDISLLIRQGGFLGCHHLRSITVDEDVLPFN